ncbi:hypothetical protein AMATHDRAFT_149489 [Amanita thiersii Skay4041]|uniref:AMP-dependent synthetase/ligase domain-containing protein n=1 Tax=Amanita thiersii Skay4041 TaxID=703135 RepID=A0A2A9NJY4_9AGAR|nr:hypothetical protein AMATHDRAFT_149489 [Amanita thiersii Skay4041]
MHFKSMYPDIPPLPPGNIHNLCLRRPDQADWPDYTVQIEAKTGKSRTFREFIQRVDYAATALGGPFNKGCLGLCAEKNDIIGIMSENSMDYVTFVHACLAIATPFALISSYSTRFELKHALQLSKSTCLFVDDKFIPLVLPVAKELGISSKKIYVMSGHVSGRKSFAQMIDEVRIKKVEKVGVKEATEDTLAYLVFSSGTSGLPKAVMLSHGNIKVSFGQMIVLAQEVAEVYTPPEPKTPDGLPKTLAFLPMHHSYGLHTYCFRAFVAPNTMVILPKWNTDLALSVIPKYKVTHLPLIPSVVHQLVHHPKTAKTDFSSVMMVGCGAAYLPVELGQRMAAIIPVEANFAEGYGMSECSISAVTQPHPGTLGGRGKKVLGTTGILLPGMEARIVREDGSGADVDEVGELWLKGPNIALGYWNNEKANRETFVDGWLHTGDRFRVDKDGYFFYADRAKDTLKVSGAQVSPVEIENVLLLHPQRIIQDATVAGVSGGRTSDEKVPRAWVVLSQSGKKMGAGAVVKELERWHQENLSRYKWLRGGIEVVKELPKNPTGKTLRRVLQDKYEREVASGKVKGKL